jgi:hypothetical protein
MQSIYHQKSYIQLYLCSSVYKDVASDCVGAHRKQPLKRTIMKINRTCNSQCVHPTMIKHVFIRFNSRSEGNAMLMTSNANISLKQ